MRGRSGMAGIALFVAALLSYHSGVCGYVSPRYWGKPTAPHGRHSALAGRVRRVGAAIAYAPLPRSSTLRRSTRGVHGVHTWSATAINQAGNVATLLLRKTYDMLMDEVYICHICICMCICVMYMHCVCVCVCVFIHMCVCIHTCVCVYSYMCVCIHTCVCVCVYVCIYICK